MSPSSRLPWIVALIGAALGLLFATYSTLDYAAHLDRDLHDVHCSFIPGAPPTSEAEACRAAMYSPYSALFKERYWGGLPISLFALGAFTFFVGFSLYLMLSGARASRASVIFFGCVAVTPLIVSLVMLAISITELGSLCKTCVGIYIASFVLAAGGLLGLLSARGRPPGSVALPLAWLSTLGVLTLAPAVVYAATVPDHTPFLTQCGELKRADDPTLVKLQTKNPVQATLIFEDPLCPTCRAFHQRLVQEGIFDRLSVKLALFPLDNTCNWMLDHPLHPGACSVSKAVLCGGDQARQVLEWAYEQQPYLTRAGKAGEPTLRAVIKERWGESMLTCIDDRQTTSRLNQHLHFATDNNILVSTPQMFLGKRRVCDADTDLGLRFALSRLAPEVIP